MPVKKMKIMSFKKILDSDKPYVIKFTNPECHLCVELKPNFHKIAKEFDHKFVFGNVDAVEEPKLSETFKIDGVPTIFIVSKDSIQEIPYPSSDGGYSYKYLKDYLTNWGY